MYSLDFNDDFWPTYNKLVKGNSKLLSKFKKTFEILSENPFRNSLKTHKVDTKKYENVYSSWVSGDVRIIWALDKNQELVILVLETGTHSGSNKIYQ